ncbi:MAG: NAD(+)/NADH kinase [Oscillospiraceae bacterium]|nr:NAD(+)/NADH kinase [Oscillospiraceae bacterium]
MKTFAIIPNDGRDVELKATKEIAKFLTDMGVSVVMEEEFCGRVGGVSYFSRAEVLNRADICVIIGGDGTILNIAADAAVANVPLIGINYGNMGFLSQAERGDIHIFKDIVDGKYSIDQRMMLEAKIMRNGIEFKSFHVLNDVVVFRGEYSRMINLSVEIDGVLAESYPADGIIISTPTGSTAYSLSAGGAILDPKVAGIIITPICPHTIRARSLVVSSDRRITVRVTYRTKMDATVAADGNEAHSMEDLDFVEITKSPYTTNLIRLSDKNFFEILRNKMK